MFCRPLSALRRTYALCRTRALRHLPTPAAPLLCVLACAVPAALHAQGDKWIVPTPDELKMTSIPEVPGAPAVVLNRDELADDDNHMRATYMRVKILTEAGKDLGDVRLVYNNRSDGQGYTVSEIAGRTIQPDGTIVPFSGKPYDKVLAKDKENQIKSRVFSLPAVQVGSIIEYRYKFRFDDHIFYKPDWDIQTDLYLRQGHFLWKPTDKELSTSSRGRENFTSTLVWEASLPKGMIVKQTKLATGRLLLELNMTDVMPFGTDEYMPPIKSTAYHVFFYYSPYKSGQEFWTTEGKYWSSDANRFMNTSGYVRDEAAKATTGATDDEAKLRSLYALTGSIENTDFTRKHTTQEDKSEGLKNTRTAEDVLKRKRGSSDEIARTFVALARAAGLNASLMDVTNRKERIFNVNWMEFGQLDDEIAVVNYGGADHFLDPGSPAVPFGHMDWRHSLAGGVRQKDKATTLALTPGEGYKFSQTGRVADLHLEDGGTVNGTVTFTFQGSPAVRWRQLALRTDNAELREDLQKELQQMLPSGSEVEVHGIANLKEIDQPLKVTYDVKAHLGTAAGSRVVLPCDIFVANDATVFPHEKRELGVYFPYAEAVQDAMRISYPAAWTVESLPAEQKAQFSSRALYTQSTKQLANSVTVYRNFTIGDFYFPPEEYPALRTFYGDFQHKDRNSLVLKRPAAAERASLP